MGGLPAHQYVQQLAIRQHGVVGRRQLLSIGIGSGLIEHSLKVGRLVPVFRGVYAVGRPIGSHRSAWMAASLAGGPTCVVSGATSAAVWGFMKPSSRLEVSRVEAHSLTMEGLTAHHDRLRLTGHRSGLLPAERTYRGPIPVMSVAGTLVQLAGSLEEKDLRRAFIEASRCGLVGRGTLHKCVEIGSGYKGAAALRELIDQWHPGLTRTRSVLEGEFLLLCSRSGIEAPEVNVRLCGLEVDCLWRQERVIVELDGRAFHGDGFSFERDRIRQNTLVKAGYLVFRWTWKMVVDEPAEPVRDLKDALDARAGRMTFGG